MKITRYFTREGQSPYADIPFRAAETGASPRSVAETFIVPAQFSPTAAAALAQRCFCKIPIPAKLKKLAEKDVPDWLWRSRADKDALQLLPENARAVLERDARLVFNRLSGFQTYWGWKNGYFDTEKDARAFHDEFCFMLAARYTAPNSAQWQNSGLHWAYGIEGAAQGGFYAEPQTGEPRRCAAAYEYPPLYACSLQSVADNLADTGGLMDLCLREARIFAGKAVSGSNFSALRGAAEPSAEAENTAGLLPFLTIGAAAAAAAKADIAADDGDTVAKMTVLDADHPDIEAYIEQTAKDRREAAALTAGKQLLQRHFAALAAACRAFPPAASSSPEQPAAAEQTAEAAFRPADNPALKKAVQAARKDNIDEACIAQMIRLAQHGGAEAELFARGSAATAADAALGGQTLRRAISLSDNFLRAVEKDADWPLARRSGNAAPKVLKARALWDKIADAARDSGASCLLFHSAANAWLTVPAAGAVRACSPNADFLFADTMAVTAACINLQAFFRDDKPFDSAAFIHVIRLCALACEISVSAGQYPSAETAQQCHAYRPIGLSYCNFGSLLMAMAIPYDSDAGRALCAALTALMSGAAYVVSAELAAELGAFKGYGPNAQAVLRVIRNHRRAAYGQRHGYEQLPISPAPLKAADCPEPDLVELARAAWDKALHMGEAYGFRNAHISLLSAEENIRQLMDSDTAGLDAHASLVTCKKHMSGGRAKAIVSAVPRALRRLGYTAEQIAAIEAYALGHGSLDTAPGISSAALKDKGFSDEKLAALNAALPNAAALQDVFNKQFLGEDFCKNSLNFTAAQLNTPSLNILAALGFTEAEIAAADLYICGALTLAGAPHLRAQDYAVFACGSRGGKNGSAALSAESSVRMMAAAQSFLSGGIGKTVILPPQAQAEDCARTYMLAWKLGLKALALGFDGSAELPQFDEAAETAANKAEALAGDTAAFLAEQAPVPRPLQTPARHEQSADTMRHTAAREQEKLPNRRQGYTQKAVIDGHKIYLRTGEFKDGRLGEIFIDMHKESAAFRAMMHNFAIAVSLGLQYGVPLEKYVEAFAFTKFAPAGLVQGNDSVKKTSSVLDYIFRELAISYLGRDDLAHIAIADLSESAVSADEERGTTKLIATGWARGFALKSNIATRAEPAALPSASADRADTADKTAASAENSPDFTAAFDVNLESYGSAFQDETGQAALSADAESSGKTAEPAGSGDIKPAQGAALSAAAGGTQRAKAAAAEQPDTLTIAQPIRDILPFTAFADFSPLPAPKARFENPVLSESRVVKKPQPAETELKQAAALTAGMVTAERNNPYRVAAYKVERTQPEQNGSHFMMKKEAKPEADNSPKKPKEESFEDALERSLIHELFGSGHISADKAAQAVQKEKTSGGEATAAHSAASAENLLKHSAAYSFAGTAERAAQDKGENRDKAASNIKDTAQTAAPNMPPPSKMPFDTSLYKARQAGRRMHALIQGYTGDICPECRNYTLRRDGAQLKCDICGTAISAS